MKNLFTKLFFVFLFNPIVYSQSSDLKQIINLFDRGEIDNVKILIDKINEKQIPLTTSNDSLNFNLYRIIKYSLTDLNPEYKDAIEWLKSKNVLVVLPYFINDFISKSINNTIISAEFENLLDLAIQVELEDKNQSVLLSKSNLFFSYRLLEIILRNQKRNNELIETKLKRINLYESNKESFKYLRGDSILYMYSDLANSEILEIKIRQDYYDKVFQILGTLGINSQKNYEYELSSYRRFIEKNNLEKDLILLPNNYLNEEYNPFLHHLNILYANEENSNSINVLKKLFIRLSSFNKKYILNYLEMICRNLNIELLKNKIDAISINNETQIENHNLLDFFKMCNIYFSNEPEQKIRLLVLNNLLDFKNLNEYDLFLNEKTRLLEELIDTSEEVAYHEWNFLIEQKLYAGAYDGATNNEFDDFFKKVLNEKISIYSEKINFIERTYDLLINFNSLISKKDLNSLQDYYLKYLSNSITEDDFLLRVKLAYTENSIDKLKDFITKRILSNPNNKELKNLKFNLLIKINALEKTTETALEAINYFTKEINSINNIFNNITVLDLLVTYNLKDSNNFIINNVLKYYIELKEESSQILSALLDLNLAFYYKKINRKYEALSYFTRIRTYDVYYDEGEKNLFNFNYGLNYFKILDELIPLNLELKQNEDAKDYIDEFESIVNTIDNNFKTLENEIIKQIDINEFSKKKNILHWYKYWFYRNIKEYEKANQSLSSFDIRIHPEFNFTIQLFQLLNEYDLKLIGREILKEKLYSIYTENNKPFDNLYYTYALLEEGEIKSGDYNLLIKTKIESIAKDFSNTSFNDQSFSTVVNNLILIGRDIKEVEYYLSLDDDKDPELVEKHLDLILKTKSIDLQNRFLGEVEESKRDEYFEILREYSMSKNTGNRNILLKRDLIEQSLKGSFEDSYFGIDQVKEKLALNEALLIVSKIEFQGDNNDLYLGYLIEKNKIELIEFEDIDFFKIYKYWLSKIQKDEIENVTYRYIAKPIIDKLSNQVNTINIIAEGIFKNINFETILDLSEETLDKRFSFNNYNGLNNIFKSTDNIDIKEAMLFGNPFYESLGGKSFDFELEQLPYTQKEINQINNILIQNGIKTIKLDSLNANEESFYNYKKKDLIHVATHGFSNKSSNETNNYSFGFYGAGISNSKNKSRINNDGIIFSEEIETTNFTNTSLVVLSACESALGETNLAGGFNLSNSFHKAGVKNVISTLWEIDDEKTMQFMNIFYKKLMLLKDPKESLIKAKEDFKKIYPQRRYWGAFIHSKI